MSQIDLFASGFFPPVTDSPGGITQQASLSIFHGYPLVDTGAIPATAIIDSVQFFAAQGTFDPQIIPAGIQPYFVHSGTPWAGGVQVPPPDTGIVYGTNQIVFSPITAVLTVNPITNVQWTRANLFADTFGWYAVWNNQLGTVVYLGGTNEVTQFFVRVIYHTSSLPAPGLSDITLTNLSVYPPTWSFALDGTGFLEGCSVFLTDPDNVTHVLSDDRILSVLPTRVVFLTTLVEVALAGPYTVTVRNPDGQEAAALGYTQAGPGVIVETILSYMHFYGYAFVRPATPNTTNAPLGLAPGATVTVFQSGTMTLESLFADAAGTTPIGNPLTADTNGFFSFYVTPEKIDVQFAGGGIASPYTIGDALILDPRVDGLQAAIDAVQTSLNSQIAAITGQITNAQKVPLTFPLGGSLVTGVENASRVDAVDAVTIQLDSTVLGGLTLTIFVTLRTENAGTSVQAVFRNVTDNLDVGSSSVSTATGNTELSFTITPTTGVKQYRLQLQPGNASAFIYGNGYLQLSS